MIRSPTSHTTENDMKCVNGDCANTIKQGGGMRLLVMADSGAPPIQRWMCIACWNATLNGEPQIALKPRTEVRQFTYEMERQLKANEDKGGWHGGACDAEFLLSEATNHLNALKRTIKSKTKKSSEKDQLIMDDTADVANFMMMIVDLWVSDSLEHAIGGSV